MLGKVSKVEKSRLLVVVLPIFILSLAFILCAAIGKAQSASFESPGGEISGTVLLKADNRPAAHVAVSLKSHVAGVFRSILTDLEGHFEIRGLPPGTYDVVAEEAGYEPVRTKVLLDGSSSKLILYLNSINPSRVLRKSGIVSVRELKIPRKAWDEYQRGLLSLEKNDPQGSVEHFKRATSAFSGYYEALYHTGVAELRLGHRDEAMQAFERAVDLSEGRYARADFGIGALLCEQGKPIEAEAVLRTGLEVDDSLPEGYALLGIALMRQGRIEEAEKSAREALLRNPSFGEAYLVLADVHASRHEYDSQLKDLETYLTLEPKGPESERVRLARELALRNLAKAHPQD